MNYINEKIATADTSFIGYLYKLAKEALGSKMTDATMDDEKLSTVLDFLNCQVYIFLVFVMNRYIGIQNPHP